jgi:hypothetical protein
MVQHFYSSSCKNASCKKKYFSHFSFFKELINFYLFARIICRYSHKFHGPGLRYELGICIRTGYIVWACGGLPCGEWSDLRLARHAFVLGLQEGEKAIADRGYRDYHYFEIPNGHNDPNKKEMMARHETLNHRLKLFRCLSEKFRHDLHLHPLYFHAVVDLTQMIIEHGDPLYTIDF